jgi:hypothetical protein
VAPIALVPFSRRSRCTGQHNLETTPSFAPSTNWSEHQVKASPTYRASTRIRQAKRGMCPQPMVMTHHFARLPGMIYNKTTKHEFPEKMGGSRLMVTQQQQCSPLGAIFRPTQDLLSAKKTNFQNASCQGLGASTIARRASCRHGSDLKTQ